MNYYATKKNKERLQNPLITLIIRLLIVLLLFSLSRWLIYLFNLDFFNHLSLGESLRLYFVGMRFDLVVIAYANIPVILYYCLPFKFIYRRGFQRIMNIYYVLVNSVILLFNMIDVIYFRFIGKRMTSEFFQFFGNSDENIGPIVGQIFVDYWYMLVLTLLLLMVLAAGIRQAGQLRLFGIMPFSAAFSAGFGLSCIMQNNKKERKRKWATCSIQ